MGRNSDMTMMTQALNFAERGPRAYDGDEDEEETRSVTAAVGRTLGVP